MPVSVRSSNTLADLGRRCLLIACLAVAGGAGSPAPSFADDVYGPTNLVKTMPTPFGAPRGADDDGGGGSALTIAGPISFGAGSGASGLRRRLSDRLVPCLLYLPGRMVIGQTAEFTIKGRPGQYVALAMADKNTGAKPIYGRSIRLGSDRKVVAVGRLSETGVTTLIIDTPIQGDLIGQNWFFEAALWSRPDFSDTEIATAVSSEGQEGIENGVLVAGEGDRKRGFKFVPNASMPMQTPESHPGSGFGTNKF